MVLLDLLTLPRRKDLFSSKMMGESTMKPQVPYHCPTVFLKRLILYCILLPVSLSTDALSPASRSNTDAYSIRVEKVHNMPSPTAVNKNSGAVHSPSVASAVEKRRPYRNLQSKSRKLNSSNGSLPKPKISSENVCHESPQNKYRTCLQRSADPRKNLIGDKMPRDFNAGVPGKISSKPLESTGQVAQGTPSHIVPFTPPYVTPGEKLTYESIYLSLVLNKDLTMNCSEKIHLEEITLEWLRVSLVS